MTDDLTPTAELLYWLATPKADRKPMQTSADWSILDLAVKGLITHNEAVDLQVALLGIGHDHALKYAFQYFKNEGLHLAYV